MRGAFRFTLSASQAVFDFFIQFTQVTVFQYQCFRFKQTKRRCIGVSKPATREQFSFVKVPFRIDLHPVHAIQYRFLWSDNEG